MDGKYTWLTDMNGLISGSTTTGRGMRRYMVVEAVPDGGWDWVAWSSDGSGACLHGRAETQALAIQAAEHGAELMNMDVIVSLDDHRRELPGPLHPGGEATTFLSP